MTANPVKAARYRPGKAIAEEPSSEEEDGSSDEEQAQQPHTAPPPKATSFPSDATKIAGNLSRVNLDERRRQAAADEAKRIESERILRAAEEEGFETEESQELEGSEEASGSESGSGSGSEESSSEDEAPRKLLRPTFIKKDKRKDSTTVAIVRAEDEKWAEEEARRKEKADAMIQEQLEKNAAAQAAGKKDWDDDEIEEVDQVDDTDDLDPETERAAWKLRELKRVKRERETIEQAEEEREEIERRRNLSKEEREAEDKDFLDGQKAEREGKGKMGYMQKYFHKGVFFQDDAKAEGLDQRDIMGSRFADESSNRELLPEYMQIRDMTKLGRKGRTKYKDMRSEDTGRWGAFESRGPRKGDGTFDERFMPDRDGGGKGASGANTTVVGERRKPPEGAPAGPRGADRTTNEKEESRGSPPRRPYSRSRSPPRRRDRSYSRSPPRRERRRRRSYSYSRSPTPQWDRRRDEYSRRKRSPSPYHDRYGSDKRRRVDAS
jgi:microfibrillar-associated protein 1